MPRPDCGLSRRVCVLCLSLGPPSFLWFPLFSHSCSHAVLIFFLLSWLFLFLLSLSLAWSPPLAWQFDCQHGCWVCASKPLDVPVLCLITASLASSSAHKQRQKLYNGQAIACKETTCQQATLSNIVSLIISSFQDTDDLINTVWILSGWKLFLLM